jgi:hypothetical protein
VRGEEERAEERARASSWWFQERKTRGALALPFLSSLFTYIKAAEFGITGHRDLPDLKLLNYTNL